MVLERILLQTIKFDLQVEHPYQFLLRYAKQLKGTPCSWSEFITMSNLNIPKILIESDLKMGLKESNAVALKSNLLV